MPEPVSNDQLNASLTAIKAFMPEGAVVALFVFQHSDRGIITDYVSNTKTKVVAGAHAARLDARHNRAAHSACQEGSVMPDNKPKFRLLIEINGGIDAVIECTRCGQQILSTQDALAEGFDVEDIACGICGDS